MLFITVVPVFIWTYYCLTYAFSSHSKTRNVEQRVIIIESSSSSSTLHNATLSLQEGRLRARSGLSSQFQTPFERRRSNNVIRTDDDEYLQNTSRLHCPLIWTGLKGVEQGVAFNFISAYYDDRVHPPSIVLLGYQLRNESSVLHCKVQYDHGGTHCLREPSIQLEMDACNTHKEFKHSVQYPYVHMFYKCPLSGRKSIPKAVAMSTEPWCNQSSVMIPVYEELRLPNKTVEIGVCVQTPVFRTGLSYLVSFIEMNRLLGAEMFTMYYYYSEESHKALSFLMKQYGDIVQLVRWNKQLDDHNTLHYHGEILAINDCLYRNMKQTKYLIFIDLDELIIPRKHATLKDMLKEVDQSSYSDSFVFINVLFLESKIFSLKRKIESWRSQLCQRAQLPVYLFFFNRVTCSFDYFARSKLVVRADRITDMDIHSVCKRIGNTSHVLVPSELAVSHHYRARPTIECHKNPQLQRYESITDTWMSKYAIQLLSSLNAAICNNDQNNIV